MEIDHIFICTEKNAAAGDLLTGFGLTEGSRNVHSGQGTANRRFFFHNMMIELLWLENPEEAGSELTKPMRLMERCFPVEKNVSPFGIALRPSLSNEPNENVPFETWDYHPVYLPEELCIKVAGETPMTEPMFFYLSFAARQDEVPSERREPMEHGIPLGEATHITVGIVSTDELSHAAEAVKSLGGISIVQGGEHYIEIEFDHAVNDETADFRPAMPLVFRW